MQILQLQTRPDRICKIFTWCVDILQLRSSTLDQQSKKNEFFVCFSPINSSFSCKKCLSNKLSRFSFSKKWREGEKIDHNLHNRQGSVLQSCTYIYCKFLQYLQRGCSSALLGFLEEIQKQCKQNLLPALRNNIEEVHWIVAHFRTPSFYCTFFFFFGESIYMWGFPVLNPQSVGILYRLGVESIGGEMRGQEFTY